MHIEFVDAAAARAQLRAQHILLNHTEGTCLSCDLSGPAATTLSFGPSGGERSIDAPAEALPRLAEAILHKLHCTEALAIPAASWRPIVEAVAESLKENPKWSAVDRTLGVEVNTSDGLVIRPTEHHLLRDLAAALLACGDRPEQSLHVCSTCGQFAITIAPPDSLVVHVRGESLAQQVRELAGHLRVA